MRSSLFLLLATSALAVAIPAQNKQDQHPSAGSDQGLGWVHMDISCAPSAAAEFERALALLHNFWYTRALERFDQVPKNDSGCAMAYWGSAMTYNHPFWDPPSQADETAAWKLVQRGLSASEASAREKLYLAAVAALYKDAGVGTKSARDQNYRDAMAAAYDQYPDDETALFYGLSILGAIPQAPTVLSNRRKQQNSSRLCTHDIRTILVRFIT